MTKIWNKIVPIWIFKTKVLLSKKKLTLRICKYTLVYTYVHATYVYIYVHACMYIHVYLYWYVVSKMKIKRIQRCSKSAGHAIERFSLKDSYRDANWLLWYKWINYICNEGVRDNLPFGSLTLNHILALSARGVQRNSEKKAKIYWMDKGGVSIFTFINLCTDGSDYIFFS